LTYFTYARDARLITFENEKDQIVELVLHGTLVPQKELNNNAP